MKNFIQNIKKSIDRWLFNWRKERAIKQAERNVPGAEAQVSGTRVSRQAYGVLHAAD